METTLGVETRQDPAEETSAETVTPLIAASEAYPALEERIFDAKREVLLGFRIFDPTTRLRSQRVTDSGLTTWADLIADVSSRGVDVRILLTDFEPTVATDLHKLTWASVRGFHTARIDAGDDGDPRPGLQVIAALHEAKVGKMLRWVFWPLVWYRVRRLATIQGVRPETLLAEAPGLAPLLGTRNPSALLPRFGTPPRLRPATYHQKLAIVDGTYAVIGGLDINERRYDTPAHDLPSDETWHDVSLGITGPVCDDARDHFIDCWNREVKPFNQRVKRLRRFVRNMPALVERMDVPDTSARPQRVDDRRLRFIRTVSRQRRTLTEFGPRPAIMEIEQAHIDAIRQAEGMIYIETQFLRSRSIVLELVAAAHRQPDLRLILLLPSAPQEVLYEDATEPPHRHGEWLQIQCLEAIRQAFGERAAFYSLVNRYQELETDDRRTIDGHPVIYIHSKVFIVDHRLAMISSANLNGRSLRWDTEAGVVWNDAEEVRAFEQRLWDYHLGSVFAGRRIAGRNEELFDLWKEAATGGPAEAERRPYIADFPFEEGRAFARKSWFVPDDLV
ncbi:phospholipase D-like domain-containing protein [Thalassobaculum sp. OXR-137]|uniref:phospholipase D family protein n=1 Tax=Thalassobaculum sp. OXR-137 TaxID=3100173 RepID=UPI002AC8B0C6|nr:phospholipase D-like domain-containing protein [Thalassobaculum sp. OXR-137]WPZ33970.1 phospholipase D-like domain-containing protein [Thalassobaculum sp. OXR-137]